MLEFVNLKKQIHELKQEINTLKNKNEILESEKLKELIDKLDEDSKCERLQKENERLRIRLQEAREIIKELKVKWW